MDTEAKGKMISAIISALRFEHKRLNKPFNEGATFFSLCFKDDAELQKICKLTGI